MNESHKYTSRGVSATKDEVHEAIKHMDKGLFPKAFCKILPDIVAGDKDYCNIMHADTAGTKTSLAYLYWRETGDLSIWKGIAQDAIVMNIDDMACVGCTDNIVLSSTIGRNKHLIPGEIIKTIIQACDEFCQLMEEHGCKIIQSGGETADVGDIVRTIDVGYTTFARLERKKLVKNEIKAGNVIVAFASYGKASYENQYNGGMGSNGLTSARHDVLSSHYATLYPESFHPDIPSQYVYAGSKRLSDPSPVEGLNIGQLLLSPTRTYMPIISQCLDSVRDNIHSIIHCSGGAQTKVLKFVENLHIIKENLLEVPPLFKLIQEESGTEMKEMFQVFNMGHRLEMYVDEAAVPRILAIANNSNIDAKVIGRVEKCDETKLSIKYNGNKYVYRV